jgi:hypothetical protein
MTSLSAELRALMVRRRALFPDGFYPMPGDERTLKASALDVEIMDLAALEGLTEVEAWRRFE